MCLRFLDRGELPGLLQLRVHRTYTLCARSSLSSDRRASSAANCVSVSASSCRMAATSSSRSVMPALFKGNDQRLASERRGLPLSGIHVHVHVPCGECAALGSKGPPLASVCLLGRWRTASAAPVRDGFFDHAALPGRGRGACPLGVYVSGGGRGTSVCPHTDASSATVGGRTICWRRPWRGGALPAASEPILGVGGASVFRRRIDGGGCSDTL